MVFLCYTQVMDVLSLTKNYETLGGAVIGQAIKDLDDVERSIRDGARQFLVGRRLDMFIETFHLPVSPGYVRRTLRREGKI